MSAEVTKFFEESQSLIEQHRLLPAARALEQALRHADTPDRRASASLNLGLIYWRQLGNGMEARRHFRACIDECDAQSDGQAADTRGLLASALENAMMCALSFDEFEDLARRLRDLSPRLPVLTGLAPEVQSGRERGESWAQRLFALARTFYDRNDPKRIGSRHGEAKSAYHLVVANRSELRVTREEWRLALFEHSALSLRMTADCITARGADDDPHSPEEFLPILTEAIPLVDEYLRISSGDDELIQVRAGMDRIVINSRRRWVPSSPRPRAESRQVAPQSSKGCLPLLSLSVALIAILAFVISLEFK
jgi:hypothetical protein